MNEKNDTSRFTIRDMEAEPDAMYMADAENLRIEKLSTRITLVAVLIPCLLVIVLAVAYLDIKNRVINTQNTGSMGVQNLSKDLESRFSNLSLKQAKLESQLADNTEALKNATAALQVNLKKSTTELKRIAAAKPDRSAFAAMTQKTEASIADLQKDMADLQKDMADLNAAFGKFDEELAAQILLMADGLKKDQGRLAAIEKKTQQLESGKLSKESMELTLGLERLGLQEMVKDKIREVEKKLAAIRKQIETLDQRLASKAQKASTPPATAPPPARSTKNTSGSSTLEEQTIE
jgi:hypothetical protein